MVLLVAAVAGVQLLGVTIISVPAQTVPPGSRTFAEAVLHSSFEEEWKLFAPSPVNADRDLVVQAAWLDGTEVVTGEWVNLSDIDDSVVAHSVGAPRSAYLTSRLAGNTDAGWGTVSQEVRDRVNDASSAEEPLTTDELVAVLDEEDDIGDALTDYLRDIDVAATTYTTDALRTLEPGREIVAVRYGLQTATVPPWDQRAEREKAVSDVRPGPWRTPAEDDPERRASIAGYLERNS